MKHRLKVKIVEKIENPPNLSDRFWSESLYQSAIRRSFNFKFDINLFNRRKAERSFMGGLTFYEVLQMLQESAPGRMFYREGWNGKHQVIMLQVPDEHSKMTQPYIYMEIYPGSPEAGKTIRIPWLASQADLLATDWKEYSPIGDQPSSAV